MSIISNRPSCPGYSTVHNFQEIHQSMLSRRSQKVHDAQISNSPWCPEDTTVHDIQYIQQLMMSRIVISSWCQEIHQSILSWITVHDIQDMQQSMMSRRSQGVPWCPNIQELWCPIDPTDRDIQDIQQSKMSTISKQAMMSRISNMSRRSSRRSNNSWCQGCQTVHNPGYPTVHDVQKIHQSMIIILSNNPSCQDIQQSIISSISNSPWCREIHQSILSWIKVHNVQDTKTGHYVEDIQHVQEIQQSMMSKMSNSTLYPLDPTVHDIQETNILWRPLYLCPTRLVCTSEDECKWLFTTKWFILLKQTIKSRHQIIFTFTIYKRSNGRYFTMLRTLCMMSSWCRIGPVLLSSWFPHGSLASSTVVDQLLILFPTGWARPPPYPPPHSDPISLRVHALTHPSVCYNIYHSILTGYPIL